MASGVNRPFHVGPTRSAATLADRAPQQGIGVVELMVGLAVGAIVVSAALTVVAQQVGTARDGAQRLRAQQDLRTVSALLNRWVRQAVPVAAGAPVFVVDAAGDALHFHVADDAPTNANAVAGLQAVSLRVASGVVEWRWGPATTSRWQALTDAQTLRVQRGRFEPTLAAPVGACTGSWSLRWSLDADLTAGRASRTAAPSAALDRVSHEVQVRHPVLLAACAS